MNVSVLHLVFEPALYKVLTEELKFDYLIRFRGNIKVTAAGGETRAAIDWVGRGGRTRIFVPQ